VSDVQILVTTVSAPIEQRTINVDLVGPGAALAITQASRAEGFANDAEGFSDDAAGSAVEAASSATSADASEANALSYASTASAAQQAVADSIAGLPANATLPLQAVSVAALQALTGMTLGRQALLSERGREGLFVFSTLNHSANVTADPYQGIYIAPASAPTGASGAWVRVVTDNTYQASWFGFGTANLTTNHLRLQAAIDLAPVGAIIDAQVIGTLSSFGSGLTTGSAVVMNKNGQHLKFTRGQTKIVVGHGEQVHTFNIRADDVTIEDPFVTGQRCSNNADARFCIEVSSRHTSGATVGASVKNARIIRPKFDDFDTGIRTIRSSWIDGFYVPTNTQIIDPKFSRCRYQAIVPWADGTKIFGGSIHMEGGITVRPFHTPIRLIGANGFVCDGLTVKDDLGLSCFTQMTGGVDPNSYTGGANDQFNDANKCLIRNVYYEGQGGFVSVVTPPSFHVLYENCVAVGDMAGTGEGAPIGFAAHSMPPRFGMTEFRGCKFYGYTAAVSGGAAQGNYGMFRMKNCEFYSNARTAAVATLPHGFVVDNAGAGLNDALGAQIVGFTDFDVEGCKFYFRAPGYNFFLSALNSKANTRFRLRNCDLPVVANEAAELGNGTGSVTAAGNSQMSAAHIELVLSTVRPNPRVSVNG
jgi:hypothetical protein